MGKIRRKFTAEFKQAIVQDILSGRATQSSAAREHQISSGLIFRWVAAAQKGQAFVDRPSVKERQLENEVEKLKAKVGELVMQIDLLKKFQTFVQQRRNANSSVVTAKNLDQFREAAKC